MTTTASSTIENLEIIVSRFMKIESITEGDPKQNHIARFTGWINREDTEAAYEELSAQLKPLDVTPLFRWEKETRPSAPTNRWENGARPAAAGPRHAIILIPGMPEVRPSNPWVNVILLVLTILSVLLTGALYSYDGPPPASQGEMIQILFANILAGWPFAVSMMGILLAHEFGHYLAGRFHKTDVTLPYFIPLPLISPLGTMGAVINMKEIPRNRRVLLDIGVTGPLAGLVVAIPVLLIGLSLSQLDPLPSAFPSGGGIQLEGNSILYLLAKFAVFQQLLPSPESYGAAGPLLYWVRYFFTGQPLPLGGVDVMLHPVAFAGWAGLLITALNLIPAGQLDGGHMLYVLLGRERARLVLPVILVLTIVLGFFWSGWWLWTVLIFLVGRAYAEPMDLITPLGTGRRLLAALALVIFVLIFTPVPLILVGG